MLFDANSAILQIYHGENKLIFNEMVMRFALYAELDFYSTSSLKQQFAGRHVVPIGHIIQIPSQPVLALSPKCCVLSREATHTNCIVFGSIRPRIEPTIYRNGGEHANHYAIDAVAPQYIQINDE